MAKTSAGSTRWRTSGWQNLLHDAVALLDTLAPAPKWSFGGGSSLAVFYDHRVSRDVDIFLASTDVLTALSPGRNPATRALLAGRSFQFPGNYLKLEMDGGEIDFILAGERTRDPIRQWEFEGREIAIETPWETAIKKIFHRSSTFKVSDAFDLAAVIDRDGVQLKAHLFEVDDRLDRLTDRLDALAATYERMAAVEINPSASGRKYMDERAIQSVIAFMKDSRRQRP